MISATLFRTTMRRFWIAAPLLGRFLFAGEAFAAEYYVATTGRDANPGTLAQPFASMQKGHDVAVAGGHSSGGNDWYNNTAYKSGTQYILLASPSGDTTGTIVLTGALAHETRNNVGFPDKIARWAASTARSTRGTSSSFTPRMASLA